jgi:23S rRNA pseudouridine955/2504/2580 synthase
VTYYAVVDTAAQKLAWLSLKPVTGRTHQLRAHMEHIGHPIIGDEKYFRIENYEFPAACRTSCICWRGGSRCRIRAAA